MRPADERVGTGGLVSPAGGVGPAGHASPAGQAGPTDYVSPFDERVRPAGTLAPRPPSVAGQHVVLLDIRKNRGAEFLDRIEVLLRGAGAATSRSAKEIFSKPAAPDVIDAVSGRAGLVVEALAD